MIGFDVAGKAIRDGAIQLANYHSVVVSAGGWSIGA